MFGFVNGCLQGPRSKWIGPGSSAAPHVRGTRRPAQSEITIDMDEEASQFLSDLDDKGMFSAIPFPHLSSCWP